MKYISIASIFYAIFYTFIGINVEGFKSRMLGGRSTKPREIKYLVGIYHDDYYICGGGIIGDRYILTAAHCVVDMSSNELLKGKIKIIAGSDNLNAYSPFAIKMYVKKFYVPKIYDSFLWNGRYPEGDIAVLELEGNLNLENNKHIQKLKLPSYDVSFAPKFRTGRASPIETAGYGRDNFTYYTDRDGKQQIHWKASRKLLKAKVELLDRSVCQNSYTGNIPDSIICGRVRNHLDGTYQGICSGDSGGPLVLKGVIVIGVISGASKSCNENRKPSIYTKTSSFKKFIENVEKGIIDDARVQML